MQIAFTTLGCPSWSLDRVIQSARQLGYDGIEPRLIAGNMDLLAAPELSVERTGTLAALREARVTICCLDSSVRFDDPSAATRAENLEAGRRHIDLAQALGAPFVRVFGDTFSKAGSPSRVMDWVVDGMRQLAAHAGSSGVSVLLESHGDFSRAQLLREAMERVDAPQAGVLWDVHHPWRFHRESPRETVEALGPWIRHTHWKDSVHSETAERGYRYVLFGEGELPAREFIDALRAIRYDGWLALEWEKHWHPAIEEPEIAFPQFMRTMRELIAQ